MACFLAVGLGLFSACGLPDCPVPCPPGTTGDGATCASVETCSSDAHDVDGGPLFSNDFDLRASVTTIPGDGYSKIPLLAIGRDSVVLTVNPSYRGTVSPSAFNLGSLGTQVSFTPCGTASSPACAGPVEIVMALASDPSTQIATTGPLDVSSSTLQGVPATFE